MQMREHSVDEEEKKRRQDELESSDIGRYLNVFQGILIIATLAMIMIVFLMLLLH